MDTVPCCSGIIFPVDSAFEQQALHPLRPSQALLRYTSTRVLYPLCAETHQQHKFRLRSSDLSPADSAVCACFMSPTLFFPFEFHYRIGERRAYRAGGIVAAGAGGWKMFRPHCDKSHVAFVHFSV